MTAKSAAALKAQFLAVDPLDQNNDLADSALQAASTTVSGQVELATSAETQTGTDAVRAVTPAGLAATTSTATRAGVVELATDAEAVTGTDTARAVTPANVRAVMNKRKVLTALGKNGTGAVTLTGAVVGDIVENVAGITAGSLGNAAASFESVITVVNQIQQSSASDLSAKAYIFDLLAVA